MEGFRIARNRKKHKEHGYILLTMLLFVALLAIGMTAAVARVDMQIRRDREEEMIHRGVQYARAIRLYVKKFGRYPTQLKDLEDTNNMHFLRRAYKDPITGKDFKLLHLGDVKTAFNSGIPGATPVGGNPAAAAGAGQPGMPQGFSSMGGNSATSPSSPGTNSGSANSGSSDSSNQSSDQQDSGTDSNGFSSQVFGGGPILGVASTSKEKSIRVFNKEDHYNQWQFIYDPTQDRGGLITGPYQPMLQGVGGVGTNVNGQAGAQEKSGSFGSGFGAQNPVQTPQMPPETNAPQQ